jgi:hypothetical protein
VRDCVNPDHLFLGTMGENIADAIMKGRRTHHCQTGLIEKTRQAFPQLAEGEWIEYANRLIEHRTPKDRTAIFWSYVDKTGDCWLWTKSCTSKGYGQFKFKEQKDTTHRIAWKLTHGPIPDGLLVLHRCDVRNCVNPAHLFLGTPKDNTQDMMSKGRHRSQLT